MTQKIKREIIKTPFTEKILLDRSKSYLANNIDFMRKLPPNSIDVAITDEPYGIDFMNREWDGNVPTADTWSELYRVLKDGAFNIVMCSPRQDVMAETINQLKLAGFKVDVSSLYWTYAEGASKATAMQHSLKKRELDIADSFEGAYPNFRPKPAVEVILVTMKPIAEKSFVDQAIVNRKGVIWVDGCRIPDPKGIAGVGGRPFHPMTFGGTKEGGWKYIERGKSIPYGKTSLFKSEIYNNSAKSIDKEYAPHPNGRYPANLLVSDTALGEYSRYFSLDEWFKRRLSRLPKHLRVMFPFLYVPKPSKEEKERNLEKFIPKKVNDGRKAKVDNQYQRGETLRKNIHETVKPLNLMMYLVELFSEPKNIVLDIFNGSGSTTLAAKLSDRIGIGCEWIKEYNDIASARLKGVKNINKLDSFFNNS